MILRTEDVLDAIVRASLQPTVVPGGLGPQGEPVVSYSSGPLAELLRSAFNKMSADPTVTAVLTAEIIKRAGAVAETLAAKLPDDLRLIQRTNSWNNDYKVEVAEWLKAPLEAALTDALRPVIEAYVAERLTTTELDGLNITVKVEVAR